MANTSQDFQKIDLPTDVFIHPKGYEFYQDLENAETSKNQFKVVKEFELTKHFHGSADNSLVLGKDQKNLTDDILSKKHFDYYRRNDNSDINEITFDVNCSPLLLENSNHNFTVWLMDEDGNYMGVAYDVVPDGIFNALCEIYQSA